MIVDLPDTTISKVSKSLVQLREQGGAVALGRVLTLVIETELSGAEPAIAAANDASREHPCRIIVLVTDFDNNAEPKLDAEIRVGGDAGASEVILLSPQGAAGDNPESLLTGLLLPDAPVVAWWPNRAPKTLSSSALGRIATRRITDSANQDDPLAFLIERAKTYSPGDSDFAWTRLTLWRTQLAAILDQPPYDSVRQVLVVGDKASPSTDLLVAWLTIQLMCPVEVQHRDSTETNKGLYSVKFLRDSGAVEIIRDKQDVATLQQADSPKRELSLPVRSLRDCLSEDLRRLDPDHLFGRVITKAFLGK